MEVDILIYYCEKIVIVIILKSDIVRNKKIISYFYFRFTSAISNLNINQIEKNTNHYIFHIFNLTKTKFFNKK